MFCDIVLPKSNEKDFCSMASKLGYEGLILVYDNIGKIIKNDFKKKLEEDFSLCLKIAFLGSRKNMKKPKFADYFFISADNDNRMYFERKNISLIYNLEDCGGHEFVHHRNSGMNQVLAKRAFENDIVVGISYSMLYSLNSRMVSQYIGRFRQNIKFCNKYNVKIKLASFTSNPFLMRGVNDIISLGLCLGLKNQNIKKHLSMIE